MSWIVESGEIDRALAQRRIRLTRANVRPGRCRVEGCLLPIPPGKGRHFVIDGIDRGLMCVNHQWAVLQAAEKGKEEL